MNNIQTVNTSIRCSVFAVEFDVRIWADYCVETTVNSKGKTKNHLHILQIRTKPEYTENPLAILYTKGDDVEMQQELMGLFALEKSPLEVIKDLVKQTVFITEAEKSDKEHGTLDSILASESSSNEKRCPHCQKDVKIVADFLFGKTFCTSCGKEIPSANSVLKKKKSY